MLRFVRSFVRSVLFSVAEGSAARLGYVLIDRTELTEHSHAWARLNMMGNRSGWLWDGTTGRKPRLRKKYSHILARAIPPAPAAGPEHRRDA